MVTELISRYPNAEISEENAGLHFTVKAPENSEKMIDDCGKCGIKITHLDEYYADCSCCPADLFLVNYSNANEERIAELLSS